MRRISLLLLAVAAAPLAAQQPRALTADDYARAEKYLAANTNPLVLGAAVRPSWLPDSRFWYRNTTAGGSEFVLVDPARRTRARAFDHERLASALSAAAGTSYTAVRLPFTEIEFAQAGQAIRVEANGKRFSCDVRSYQCTADTSARREVPRNSVVSPDGKKAAYIREYNLWLRDLETGRETQLTTDGVKDFGYATDNAGWTRSERAILLWSPDSKKIATFQQDERNVGEMYLASTNVGHPTLRAWKYPLPGDSVVA
ncbi:MAG TPA: DPP IV N-terminal domain-containing protein, partial [Longimicrobiales bacterium]|nr:DPP IV N-terminal domain-containing protein [Longimicrobiales bacterium]